MLRGGVETTAGPEASAAATVAAADALSREDDEAVGEPNLDVGFTEAEPEAAAE